jgi:hypothetical protein
VCDPEILSVSEGYRQYGVTHISTATNFDQREFVYRLPMIFRSSKAAFLKMWSADRKWSSGSAVVVLLD